MDFGFPLSTEAVVVSFLPNLKMVSLFPLSRPLWDLFRPLFFYGNSSSFTFSIIFFLLCQCFLALFLQLALNQFLQSFCDSLFLILLLGVITKKAFRLCFFIFISEIAASFHSLSLPLSQYLSFSASSFLPLFYFPTASFSVILVFLLLFCFLTESHLSLMSLYRPWFTHVSLEKGTVTHSSILAWRVLWTREAWWATIHRFAKSQTQLKWLSMSAHTL